MLGRFLNTLIADGKYSLPNRDSFLQHLRMQLSLIRKTFSEFFFAFSKFTFYFEHFQKKMTLIADVFSNLRAPNNVVR